MLPQSKPLVHRSPVPVQNELWGSCSTVLASLACITAWHFCTSGMAARHRCLGAACKVFQVAQPTLKPTHFAYFSRHKLNPAFIFLIFNFLILYFLKQHKSHRVAAFVQICSLNCVCIFNSNPIWHSTWKLGSKTEDKGRKVSLLRILLQEKLTTLSSCFYLDLLQTATNWTSKRELTFCIKNNFALLAHEILL